jgi:hypothetical protein
VPLSYIYPSVGQAALLTAGVSLSLSAVATMARSDRFLRLGGPIAVGFGALIATGIASALSPEGDDRQSASFIRVAFHGSTHACCRCFPPAAASNSDIELSLLEKGAASNGPSTSVVGSTAAAAAAAAVSPASSPIASTFSHSSAIPSASSSSSSSSLALLRGLLPYEWTNGACVRVGEGAAL